MNDYNVLNDYF